MSARMSMRAWRANAALTALLCVVVFVQVNGLARRYLDVRADLSEEGLYSLHPATIGLLGELEDVLAVEAFFTGQPEHAIVQVAKSGLQDRLRELQEFAGGQLEYRERDPNGSTTDRLDAEELGIVAQPFGATQGTANVRQNIYFGLVLRYRGRERVLPWVLPQSLEAMFASALHDLLRERRATVGVLDVPGYDLARDQLAARYRVVDVDPEFLTVGEPVPAEVEILVAFGPRSLHPRAAFAIDQFVQQGGRALLFLDRAYIPEGVGTVLEVETGLEPVLDAWGTPLHRGMLFDQRCVRANGIEYPYFPSVTADSLDEGHPVTAQLPGAQFYWLHPFDDTVDGPAGVERVVLASSSEIAWTVPPLATLQVDPNELAAQERELLATQEGRPRPIALALSGTLPSAFAESGAPLPDDPLIALEHDAAVEQARREGREPPPFPTSTDEVVWSAERSSEVILVADATCVSDTNSGKLFGVENRMFLANAIDYLALETELMQIRSRIPKERELVDFLEEERRARGLGQVDPRTTASQQAARELGVEGEARAAATRRRWIAMVLTALGSLAVFGLVTVLVRLPEWLARGGPR